MIEQKLEGYKIFNRNKVNNNYYLINFLVIFFSDNVNFKSELHCTQIPILQFFFLITALQEYTIIRLLWIS